MSVRAYLRSPVAIAWTLAGVLAVGTVIVAAFRIATLARRSTFIADPTATASPFGFVFSLVFATVVIATAALVWLPCSLAIAYAVGHRLRGGPSSISGSIDRIESRIEPLYRLTKTRIAIDPIADRILSENDVRPAEIAAGCNAFVIPALALDSPTLRTAVGRANRAIPQPGRERILLVGAGSTVLLVVAVIAVGTFVAAAPSWQSLAIGAAAVGVVLTAALDMAWRTGTYAQQDIEEGFGR